MLYAASGNLFVWFDDLHFVNEFFIGFDANDAYVVVFKVSTLCVGTGKFFGLRSIVARISPNLPETFCATFAYKFSPIKIMKTCFWYDLQKQKS